MAQNTAPSGSARTRDLDEALNRIMTSSSQVGDAIRTWKEASHSLQKIGPSTDQVERELAEIRSRLDECHSHHSLRLAELKEKRNNETRKLSHDLLSLNVRRYVEEETEKQVRLQFDQQLHRVLPVSVEEQNKDLDLRVDQIDAALRNSQSRAKNSTLTAHNGLYSLVESVWMPGSNEASKLFPSTLQSLFYYSEEEVQGLCKDYQLEIDDSHTINMNRFLNHIGVKNVNYRVAPQPKKTNKGKPT